MLINPKLLIYFMNINYFRERLEEINMGLKEGDYTKVDFVSKEVERTIYSDLKRILKRTNHRLRRNKDKNNMIIDRIGDEDGVPNFIVVVVPGIINQQNHHEVNIYKDLCPFSIEVYDIHELLALKAKNFSSKLEKAVA